MVALNIRGSDSTTRSNDASAGASANVSDTQEIIQNVTKQALLYDKDHVLVNMLREIKEKEVYALEIIDRELLQFNGLESPMI